MQVAFRHVLNDVYDMLLKMPQNESTFDHLGAHPNMLHAVAVADKLVAHSYHCQDIQHLFVYVGSNSHRPSDKKKD